MKRYIVAALLLFPFAVFAEEKNGPPVPSTGNVTLSLDEYTHLLELASKPKPRFEIAPVPYALQRAELSLRVNSECVSGTMRLEGEVFGKGDTKVPLSSGLTILNAHQDGRPLPLEQENGTNIAVLPGAAGFAVTLDVGMPLNSEPGEASFALPVPMAGSVRVALGVARDHFNLRLRPRVIIA